MSDALSLPAAQAAFEIAGVEKEARPAMLRLLFVVHEVAVERQHAKQRRVGGNG